MGVLLLRPQGTRCLHSLSCVLPQSPAARHFRVLKRSGYAVPQALPAPQTVSAFALQPAPPAYRILPIFMLSGVGAPT